MSSTSSQPLPPSNLRLLIAVCTYNERDNLPRLIELIQKYAPSADCLVVDDGSPDGTADWVEAHSQDPNRLHLINRGSKLGLGSAILTAIQYGIANGYDWLINLDADLSHDPAAIPNLWLKAVSGSSDLVIGSRYVDGGGMAQCSWKRILVSRCANWYARILLGWTIRDASSAFRAYRLSKMSEIPLGRLRCSGYGWLEEILWWILEKKGQVVEVPITYTERELGDSKISWREAWGTAQVIHRLSWNTCKRAFRLGRSES